MKRYVEDEISCDLRSSFGVMILTFHLHQACDVCLGMGSKDNMTILIVKFPAQKVGTGGGVRARRQLREGDSADAEDADKTSTSASL